MKDTLAYFLTWTTYGTWLHGDPRGSVDDNHNARESSLIPADRILNDRRRENLTETPFVLCDGARDTVRLAITDHAKHRGWKVHALNIRTNHVHVVITSCTHSPEIVMGQLKSWGTRYLADHGLLGSRKRVWTKMGSTRWIKDQDLLSIAIEYVNNHQ